MVFVSVIRLVSVWFLVRQAPVVTQLTGLTGQLGAVIAAAPLSWALHSSAGPVPSRSRPRSGWC